MESCQQSFEKYLIENHKAELENFILSKLEEAKSKPFYDSESSPVSYDDSMRLYETSYTIGEKCKSNDEIFNAYTGERRATFISGSGFDCTTVGDEIESEINYKINEAVYSYVEKNRKSVYEELLLETDIEDNLSTKELTEYVLEYGVILDDFSLLDTLHAQGGIIRELSQRYD